MKKKHKTRRRPALGHQQRRAGQVHQKAREQRPQTRSGRRRQLERDTD